MPDTNDESPQDREPKTKRRQSIIKENFCTYCSEEGHLIFHCSKRIRDNDKHRPEIYSEHYYKRY